MEDVLASPKVTEVRLEQDSNPTGWGGYLLHGMWGNLYHRLQDNWTFVSQHGNVLGALKANHREDAPLTSLRPLMRTLHIVQDPAAMKAVLNHPRNSDFFSLGAEADKHPILQLVNEIFPGLNLGADDLVLSSSKDVHKALRKEIRPSFSAEGVAKVQDRINEIIGTRVAEWGDTGTICLTTEAHKLSAEVIGKAFLGATDEDFSDIAGAIQTLVNYMGKLYFMKAPFRQIIGLMDWYTGKVTIDREEIDAALKVVRDKSEEIYNNPQEGTIIHNMLQNGDFTEQQVKGMIFMILVAGQETTAGAITYMLFKLAQMSDLQEEVRSGEVRPDWMLKETMRKCTPAAVTGRLARVPLKLTFNYSDGHHISFSIDKGSALAAGHYFAARSSESGGENPDAFDPRRWEDNKTHPMSLPFVPFGWGPTQCPGASLAWYELEQVLTTSLSGYKLSTDREDEPPMVLGFTGKFKDSVNLTLEKIEG